MTRGAEAGADVNVFARHRATAAAVPLALAASWSGACAEPRAAARSSDPSPAAMASPQTPPVDFAFDSLDERPVTAEASRGKPTVIAFVTTDSVPAQAQVDFLVAMARNDAERVNYLVVALETRESRELVEMYRSALAVPFPVAMADEPTLSGAGAFGDVRAVPVTVLLDRSGRVVWRVDGRVARSAEIRGALRGL